MYTLAVGIVGSRRRDSMKDFRKVLDAFAAIETEHQSTYEVEIVSGGCAKGGDKFAYEIAEIRGKTIHTHFPRIQLLDAALLKVNPRAAYAAINYARNKIIADASDILIACVAEDRTGGTENTIKWFLRRTMAKVPARQREAQAIALGKLVLV